MLGCASNNNIQQIFKVQKKAIHIISRKAYAAHTDPIFLETKNTSISKTMHSMIYNYCPSSLLQIFQRNEQCEITQNFLNDVEYVVPHPRIEFLRKSLLYRLSTE